MPSPTLCRVIAHRGDASQAPENTLAAFTAALESGADQIELDVRRSQDGVLLVYHDPDLEGEPLATLTWAEIQARQPAIPTLEATLLHLRGKISLDLELKEAGYEEEVLALIGDILPLDQVPDHCVITSFLPQVVQQIKTQAPPLPVGLLVDRTDPQVPDPPAIGSLFQALQEVGGDFLALHYSWLGPELLHQACEIGIPLYVWTVNHPHQMRAYFQSPIIQGLITDRPQLACAIRASLRDQRSSASS